MDYEFIVDETAAGRRIDQFLCEQGVFTSRSQVQVAIRDGRVRSNGEVVRKTGERVARHARIHCQAVVAVPDGLIPQVPACDAERLSILYQDDDILIINKPAGICVHAGAGNPHQTVVERVLGEGISLAPLGLPLRPGVVHRLDKGTSGVMVLAKTNMAYHELIRQFSERRVAKTYLSVVWGRPRLPSGTVRTRLARHPMYRQKFRSTPRSGKEAVTHYRLLGAQSPFALLEARIETGRTHQIRVHFSELGLPIVGDAVYGGGKKRQAAFKLEARHLVSLDGLDRPLLHAYRLSFAHPVSHQPMDSIAPLSPIFLPFIDTSWMVSYEQSGKGRV